MSATVTSYSDKLNKAIHQKGMVSSISAYQMYYITILSIQVADMFKVLEDNTGVQRLYIAYGIIGFTLTWLAFGFGGQLVANGIG